MSEVAKELIRVLLFVAAVFSVLAFAAYSLTAMAYHRLRKTHRAESAAYRRLTLASFALSALGILCFAYGYAIEPYWPEVTHVQVKSAKVTSHIRIVHISDVHSDSKPRLEQRLPALIAAEKPDIIVFTGDSMNSDAGTVNARTLFAELTKVADVYVAPGNWDYGLPDEFFSGIGAKIVDGTARRIQVRRETMWISGIRDRNRAVIGGMLDGVTKSEFSLFLAHRPDEILDVAHAGKVDLYLAGHTHGGQVALPFYGALITLSRFGKRFESGLHRVENTWLYVNRGIGMEGGSAPRVRFLARPEVTVIDLVPQG